MQSAILVAAISGIILGANAPLAADGSGRTDFSRGQAPEPGGKHACKGQNQCKGQGGCKTGKHACKGQNECKGQGGCRTDGQKMPKGDSGGGKHSCSGKNGCPGK